VSDLIFDDPCVLFALGREARPFLREFRPQQRFRGAPCWARFCGPSWLTVLAVVTGIGREHTEAALDWVLSSPAHGGVPYRPKLVLSAGFSGALQEGLGVGDLVLATEVVNAAGKLWSTTWPGELPPGEWRPPLRRGRVLSVPAVVSSPGEKQELGRRHGALAVDMESAAVAARCSQAAIPFGCCRAISDDVVTSLPSQLSSTIASGHVSLARLAGRMLISLGLCVGLWRLAGQTHFAARHLGQALGELLTLSLPFGAELG
jgi:adenosylhomocysteine nucleosidase